MNQHTARDPGTTARLCIAAALLRNTDQRNHKIACHAGQLAALGRQRREERKEEPWTKIDEKLTIQEGGPLTLESPAIGRRASAPPRRRMSGHGGCVQTGGGAMPRKPRRRTWGSGSVSQRGGRWWIRWRQNGRQLAKSYATKDLAEKVLAKITRDVAAGGVGLPRDYDESPNLETLAKVWLERRKATHRSCRDDRSRWNTHLGPAFGKMKAHEIDAAQLRRFIEGKLAKGLAANTVGNLVRQMSTFFADIVEQGHAPANPVSALPRSTRRLYRPGHDSRTTAFIEKMSDIERVFRQLPSPVNIAFAVGAFAGLRTGEVLGLNWRDVDIENRRLHIRQQVNRGRIGSLKDDDSRVVPMLTPLVPVLTEWRLATGGQGMLFAPAHPTRGGRPDIGTDPTFVRPPTFARHLRLALTACGLPGMTWYQATRHTFASQFVLGGGSIEKLSKILGHASVVTTERYSHLRADLFRQSDYDVMPADLSSPMGNVVSLPRSSRPNEYSMRTAHEDNAKKKLAFSN